MITRIVLLHFKAPHVESAKKVLMEIAPMVRGFEGCSRLEVLFDVHNPRRIVTYSHWESEEALTVYRNSEVFQAFWQVVKPLFASSAIARSLKHEVILS